MRPRAAWAAFPWGDIFDGALLNYCDKGCAGVSDASVDDGFPIPRRWQFPAGASWCGALDMAGNVREWVADRYGLYSSERQVNPAARSRAIPTSRAVARGTTRPTTCAAPTAARTQPTMRATKSAFVARRASRPEVVSMVRSTC